MFEKALEDKFKKIFELKKVSYDEPGDAREQECLFIEVETSRNQIKDGRQKARVTGSAVMFGPNDKIPFGFFSKKIKQADPDDTRALFFFDIEVNTRRYQNIVQRGFSFVYFFDAQYDPDVGEIEEIEMDVEFD